MNEKCKNEIKNAMEEFCMAYGKTDLVALLLYMTEDTTLPTIAVSSEWLDELDPFQSTFVVVDFLKENNSEILKKVDAVITVHTEDESMKRLINIVNQKEATYLENVRFFGTTISKIEIIL